MTQEEVQFQFFEDNQLKCVDFSTGRLDVWGRSKVNAKARVFKDVGSLNVDGYERVRCNRSLRMKHRLLFWLFHRYLPEEVDHFDGNRSNNCISNLVPSTRSANTANKTIRSYSHLSVSQVEALCKRIAQGGATITELARDFGRSRVQIKAIMSKKYWRDISDKYF